MSFEHNSARKNLFLSACFCWDSRLSLREMDQKFEFGGTIGYGYSYLTFDSSLQSVQNLHGMVWSSGRLVYSELSNILP